MWGCSRKGPYDNSPIHLVKATFSLLKLRICLVQWSGYSVTTCTAPCRLTWRVKELSGLQFPTLNVIQEGQSTSECGSVRVLSWHRWTQEPRAGAQACDVPTAQLMASLLCLRFPTVLQLLPQRFISLPYRPHSMSRFLSTVPPSTQIGSDAEPKKMHVLCLIMPISGIFFIYSIVSRDIIYIFIL